jgi:hypothetical protein
MARRLIITAGWLAAAVLAVLVGLVAVSVIGDGLVSPLAKPLNESEVARELAAAPEPSAPSPSLSPSASPSSPEPSSSSRTFTTRGGTLVAQCAGGAATIRSMSPAQGFSVHERNGSEGEFRGVSDNHDRVKVDASCRAGEPHIDVESENRDDD